MGIQFFLTAGGQYYEGDRVHALDTEVMQRPDANHVPEYDREGAFVGWVALSVEDAPVSAADALAAGQAALLKVWQLVDPISAAKDENYRTIARAVDQRDADAADVQKESP